MPGGQPAEAPRAGLRKRQCILRRGRPENEFGELILPEEAPRGAPGKEPAEAPRAGLWKRRRIYVYIYIYVYFNMPIYMHIYMAQFQSD